MTDDVAALPSIDPAWFTYWLVGFGIVAFGAAEFAAIRYAKGRATLSYNINATAARVPGGYWLVWFFLAWLGWHFTFGRGHRWWPKSWFWSNDTTEPDPPP